MNLNDNSVLLTDLQSGVFSKSYKVDRLINEYVRVLYGQFTDGTFEIGLYSGSHYSTKICIYALCFEHIVFQ